MMPEKSNTVLALRDEIVGINHQVSLLDGSRRTYVNLDNAASTPPLLRVKECVDQMMEIYSSVHRGSGFKSLVSTRMYDEAREIVAGFIGADLKTECVIFVKNASEAINKLANRFGFEPGDMVMTTRMEHHSNDLPWRPKAQVIYANLLADGSLDIEDVKNKFKQYGKKIKLLAVTGASNVSGYLPPIYDLAEMAHRNGSKIFVDCAQLFPHRKINMGPADSPRHLDFIAMSAHKVYAPFGGGALVGSLELFNQGEPDYRGGGTIDLVTLTEVQWTSAPERDEAGSPNVIGAVALAASIRRLEEIGMDALAAHEKDLTRYLLQKLNKIPGIQVSGSNDPERLDDRLGVVTFQVEGLTHGIVAAIMGFEGGIGVRNGCFCAHPYVLHLLGITQEEFNHFHEQVLNKDRSDLPGLVRASFGCYNNFDDVDALVVMLERITRGDYRGKYSVDKHSGSYYPEGFDISSMDEFFTI